MFQESFYFFFFNLILRNRCSASFLCNADMKEILLSFNMQLQLYL